MAPQAKLVDTTLVCDTSIYAAGDLLVATQKIPDTVRDIDHPAVLETVTLIDTDNQGAAMDIYFMDVNGRFGTINQPPSITTTVAASVMARLSVAAADWKAVGTMRIATFSALNMPIKPVGGSRDIYVAVVNGAGTPMFSASGLKMRLGLKYI